ncbi:MAG: hypothetical protein ACOYA8_09345, partial [Clostridium sp.]
PDHALMALTHNEGRSGQESCCCGVDPAEKNREFVGRRWERRDLQEEPCCCGEPGVQEEPCCCCGELDMTSMEGFLKRARSHGFTITSMAFQDAGNLDIERLRQCSLHVYRDGKYIPFCACYLSPMGQS